MDITQSTRRIQLGTNPSVLAAQFNANFNWATWVRPARAPMDALAMQIAEFLKERGQDPVVETAIDFGVFLTLKNYFTGQARIDFDGVVEDTKMVLSLDEDARISDMRILYVHEDAPPPDENYVGGLHHDSLEADDVTLSDQARIILFHYNRGDCRTVVYDNDDVESLGGLFYRAKVGSRGMRMPERSAYAFAVRREGQTSGSMVLPAVHCREALPETQEKIPRIMLKCTMI